MKSLEELEAAWRAACAARDAANAVVHEKTEATKEARHAWDAARDRWLAASTISDDAFWVYLDAARAADRALDVLCAAREAASIAPMGDA